MKVIAQHSFPARGGVAPCTLVLSDAGGDAGNRYATHWRNEDCGGLVHGRYHMTLADGLAGFDARLAEEAARHPAASRPAGAGAFAAELWGSHKDEGNDDCWTGGDHATLAEAVAGLRALQAARAGRVDWAYACIEGPAHDGSGTRVRLHEEFNPTFRPSADLDDDARSEFAMTQGMAHGVAGHNEALGQEVEDEPAGPRFR